MAQDKKIVKVMPAGLPFIGAGAIWFLSAMILPIYKISMIVIATVLAIAAAALLNSVRKKQIESLPPAPTVKVRAEELARKIDECRIALQGAAQQIKDKETAERVASIAATLEKIADDVENDPKDRNKVRKLANHYTSMIEGLVEKYIVLEKQEQGGENISTAMEDIKKGLETVDKSMKSLLDDLFSDDAMEVSADIAVLEDLFKIQGSENRIDFENIQK